MKYFLVYWLVLSGGVATGHMDFDTIEACRAARTDMQVQADEFGGPKLTALCVKH